MKRIGVLLLLLSLGLGVQAQNPAKLTCKVQSDIPVRVVIQEPFEKFSGSIAYIDTCSTKGYGNNVELTKASGISEPTYYRIVIFDNLDVFRSLTEMVVCPGEAVSLNLELKDGRVWTAFNGQNSKGHEYFNQKRFDRMAFYQPIKSYLGNLSNDRNRFMPSVFNLVGSYTNHFDTLFAKGDISKTYLEAIKKNYTIIVADFIASEFNFPRIPQLQNLDSPFRRYAQEALYNAISPTDSTQFSLLVGSTYLQAYATYLQNKRADTATTDSVLMVSNKKIKVHHLFKPLLYIDNAKWREMLWVVQLSSYIGMIPEMPENQIDVFSALFPQSRYTPYLHNLYKKEHRPEAAASSIYPIYKIDSLGKIKTLNELITTHFKGKNVLVDIWATWCGPCKQEFKYNHFADSVVSAHKGVRLYISIDNQSSRSVWLKDIDKNHLGGYHVLVGKELYEDLMKNIPFTGIPHYAIINSKGEIVDAAAERPSNKSQFIKNIHEKLGN